MQSPEPGHLLTPGDTATSISQEKCIQTRQTFSSAEWLQRRLVFNGETLDEVVAQFNRYNQVHILVEGTELGARQVEGVFDADRPQTLFHFLMKRDQRLIVDATNSGKSIIRFRSQEGS